MRFIVEHLTKNYEDKNILNNISFTFESGKIYGLLGRNGAGKTTMFNCINHDIKFESGHFYLEDDQNQISEENPGHYVAGNREQQLWKTGERRVATPDDIGYVLSTPTVPEFLTAREFVKFYIEINQKNIQHLQPIDWYFDLLNIEPYDRDKLLKDFSHGMKNKMQMMMYFIMQPNILLLDEPLTSVDVVVAEEMKQLLRKQKENSIILFSTHIMELALDLCDEIVILNHGGLELIDKNNCTNDEVKEKIIHMLKEEGHETDV